jgi:hypothetical protein
MALINGVMESFITESGKKVKCKELESIIYHLLQYIKASLKMTKNMEKVKASTSWVKYIEVLGPLIWNMDMDKLLAINRIKGKKLQNY